MSVSGDGDGLEGVSQQAVARVLGITPRQINRLYELGFPSKIGKKNRREHDLTACVPWYIQYKINEARQKDDTVGDARKREANARATKMEADAETALLAVYERRANMVTRAFMGHHVEGLVSVLRSGLMNFAGRWAPELVGLPSTAAVRAKLEPAVRELMEDLARAGDEDPPDLPEDPDTIGDEETQGSDDARAA